ncbi:hypothetical protein TWF718_010835 [Orbilia javanica]|uniref:Amine oxidase domain-containing protein n=1 Tax=Orbilia javanica TaxID=47235 RepID=A0AAN8NMX3_9PEZI
MPFLNIRSDISIRNQWAREHATLGLKELLNEKLRVSPGPAQPPFGPDEPLPPLDLHDGSGRSARTIANPKVAIIGAGAAGLFSAMILDYLNNNETLKKAGFNVAYEIFEAADEDRKGGRLFTYNFKPKGAINPQGPHDYYDVGAMRFPENKVMRRLFDLFQHLHMKKGDLADNPPLGSLVPYYIQNIDDGVVLEPWCFNNITKWGGYKKLAEKAANADAFYLNGDAEDNSHKIPVSILKKSPDDTVNDTIRELRDALKEDLESHTTGGWELLLTYDKYSTRQFLGVSQQANSSTPNPTLPPFNYETIEFLETFNGGTNWYDQAHSETVLESLDFEYSDESSENKWWAILGGATQLAIKMENTLATKPLFLSPVTAIRVGNKADMEIDIRRPSCTNATAVETREYNGVFNTTTLGCLKRMDIKETSLNYTTRQAIRSLGYGPSAKVGIKFKRAWWIHDLPDGYKIKKGGLGHSDLSIRTCVYPSYNINDPKTEPAVLLCSYTWQQDAERIGALISSNKDHDKQLKDEAELRELLLQDLARMHTYEGTTKDNLYKLISSLYLDHYAHDWTHDPLTAGAFAFFRPQQFSNVWNKLIHPSGNLIIIGEATSPHHAWVVGALESAVHGICIWLGMRCEEIKGAAEAIKLLQVSVKGNPFVGLPPYMDSLTSNVSAVNARDDMEKYNEAKRGRSNPFDIAGILRTARDAGYRGEGGIH